MESKDGTFIISLDHIKVGLKIAFKDAEQRFYVSADYIQNNDGSYAVVKGSKLKEELTEINIAGGIEWWYNDVLAFRTGMFYENRNKGNRQFLNFGASLKYNMFSIDFSYLASVSGRQSPLANTLRFTLRLNLGRTGGLTPSGI